MDFVFFLILKLVEMATEDSTTGNKKKHTKSAAQRYIDLHK